MHIAKFDRYDMVNNPNDDTASMTVWFAGCSFRCENCHNPQLWEKTWYTSMEPKLVCDIIRKSCAELGTKYVVLLGGEPLQQDRKELLWLCTALKQAGLKIWLYTGYDIDQVPHDIKKTLYTIKCGRYIEDLKQDGFPASSNQKVYRYIAGDLVDITEQFRRLEV